MKRQFHCARHVASFDKQQPDLPSTGKDRKLPLGPLGLKEGEYAFTYSYPLSKKVSFLHKVTAETTAGDLLDMGAEDYRKIYAEEEAACGPTDNISGMMNRQRSYGPYGIWGHGIDDLEFEGVNIDCDLKEIKFMIGS